MAQVTVEQLAETVGASVDRLALANERCRLAACLRPMRQCLEEDKQTLLMHLKKSHGEKADAPKKITLKRKIGQHAASRWRW